MHKDFIKYVNWPSRIVCTIPDDKQDLIEKLWAANPDKLIYISRDRFSTNLTHLERAQMDNCPTCPKKCPLSDIEGEIDENYEELAKHEDKIQRRKLVEFVVNKYLGPLLPYSYQTLQFFFTRDLDIQRVIKAANYAMVYNKSFEECYIYLKPVLISTAFKISAQVISEGAETVKEHIKTSQSFEFAKYILKNNLIDLKGFETDPDDSGQLTVRCDLIISKSLEFL